MSDKIFAKGLMFRRPREGAPDYVKGSMAVKSDEFINFLKDNSQYLSPQGWMNFDLKVSKDGATLYFEVNDKNEVINARESHNAKVAGQDIDASSIPF